VVVVLCPIMLLYCFIHTVFITIVLLQMPKLITFHARMWKMPRNTPVFVENLCITH